MSNEPHTLKRTNIPRDTGVAGWDISQEWTRPNTPGAEEKKKKESLLLLIVYNEI